jgi:hypothetical protein
MAGSTAWFRQLRRLQLFVSSFPIMTSRPVTALLHGLAYWFIGATSWPYHAVNFVLLLASVLLVHGAPAAVNSQALAFLTAMLMYPSASGTAFSSIMVNSNLARLVLGDCTVHRYPKQVP